MFATYGDFENRLDHMLRASEHMSSQALEALEMIKDRSQLSLILRMLLDDEQRVSEIAARSYGHSNGFDKFVLSSFGPTGYKLRLHIWNPDSSAFDVEHIHSHAWDFASSLITGSYKTQIFQQSDDGNDFYHYIYRGPTNYSMRLIEHLKLSCVLDIKSSEGDTYSLKHTAWHRVINQPDTLTSTLIITGPVLRAESDVFSEGPIPGEEKMAVQRLSPEELRNKLSEYLAVIDSEPALQPR